MARLQKHKYMGGSIPLSAVIVFPQPRKTFDQGDLMELADDIATNGILQPSISARLSLKSFTKYKEVFEKISDTTLSPIETFPSVTKNKARWYYPLIAGERRYQALRILWDKGCTKCQEKARKQKRILVPGTCYKRHFGSDRMEIRACTDIEPIMAKSAQFRENNYIKPPIHEEAHEYQKFYRYLKLTDPKMGITKFASVVGVSPEKIRRALAFCELPERARKAVESKMISFSNGIELQKIMQFDLLEQKVREAMVAHEIDYLLINPRVKNEDYQKRVKNILEDSTQQSLFNANEGLLSKGGKRKVVEENLIPYLTILSKYMVKIIQLRQDGTIGKGKIYSGGSPTRQIKNIVAKLEQLVPGFTLTNAQRKNFIDLDFDTKAPVTKVA